MNYENYDYLTETVFRRRFGIEGAFDKALEEQMKQVPAPSEIRLKAASTFGTNTMEYEFKLEHNPEKDRYYLNSVSATITRNDGSTETQAFNIYSQTGLNITQMHNVMEGRFAWREYQKWDSELQQLERQSGWFFKDENRLDQEGKPMIRVLNDEISKFDLMKEISDVPLSLNQKEKNDLLMNLKQGNPVTPYIKMPNGTSEKVNIVVHPQKGLQVFNMQGERLRFRKVNSNVIPMDGSQSVKVSETTAKLIEKGEAAAKGQGEEASKSSRKKVG